MAGQRERARQAYIADITAEARRQLARDGAAGLSLRSVARELGMVSSAVYRYVASRDELLTLLIVEAYGDLAAAVEAAIGGDDDGRVHWRSACASVRAWAVAHPHEYALLYGSPVPGYSAPQDTIGPATRLYAALVEPVRHRRGRRRPSTVTSPVLEADAERVAAALGFDVGAPVLLAALGAIASLFGLVSFELFGHTNNVITDHDAFFALRVEALADELGL